MEPWTLADSLALVRGLQQDCRKYGYHLCLGGGVLNKGISKKDVDLYFLPLDNGRESPKEDELVKWLTDLWGEPENIFKDYEDEEDSAVSNDSSEGFNSNPAHTFTFDVETPITGVIGNSSSGRIQDINRTTESFWRNQSTAGTGYRILTLSYEDWMRQFNPPKETAKKEYVSPYKRKLKFMRNEIDRIDVFIL